MAKKKKGLYSEALEKPNAAARWAEFFVKNYRITILLIVLLVVSGVYALFSLPREGFPEITPPVGVVVTPYPGATASDVESGVTKPIEKAVAQLENVEDISSTSQNSVSQVVVNFDPRSDLDQNLQRLREEVSSAQSQLPEDAEASEVIETSANGFDILLNIAGDKEITELGRIGETIADEVGQIPGVKDVEVSGAPERQIVVTFSADSLRDQGVTVDQVQGALAANNLRFPGGVVTTDDSELQVTTLGEVGSLEELREIVVGQSAAGLVRLQDVADIEDGTEEIDRIARTGYVKDGELVSDPSVNLSITKQSGADIVDITADLNQTLDDLRMDGTISDEVEPVILYNTANDVERNISELSNNAWVGLILIVIVLMAFITFRTSIVVAMIIPLVLLVTFTFLQVTGLSINVLTLFSLILTLGILVDNAIVIAEGIQLQLDLGQKRIEAVRRALHEVGLPVITATATTIMVFVPMAFVGGISGEFIKFIPYTVIVALSASLFVALTIIPFLGYKFMRPSKKSGGDSVHDWKIISRYGEHLARVLGKRSRRIATFVLPVVLFVASIGLLGGGTVEVNIWPALDDNEFITLSMKFPNGTTAADEEIVRAQLEDAIEGLPEVQSFAAFGGESLFVNLTEIEDRDITSVEIEEQLQEKIDKFDLELPNGEAEVSIQKVSAGPPESEFAVEAQLSGDNLDTLAAAAGVFEEFAGSIEGVERVENTAVVDRTPQVKVRLRRDQLESRGISVIAAASTVRTILQPQEIGTYVDASIDESVDIVARFPGDARNSVNDVRDIQVASPGGFVPLRDIADIEEVSELDVIERFDQKRFVEVRVQASDDADPATLAAIPQKLEDEFDADRLEELGLSSDALTFRGQFQEEEEAFNSLGLTFVVAVLLIYIILVAQFNSYSYPLIILFAIPMSLIGVFPGLALTGNFFSFFAMLGIIALAGVVVNDAIVFISTINSLRREGLDLEEAIVESAKLRFKPILSTTITSIGGLLPLTLTAPIWEGLGVAFISGLFVGTLATLLVIPVIYYSFTKLGERLGARIVKSTKKA